jgi:hypothetical protein
VPNKSASTQYLTLLDACLNALYDGFKSFDVAELPLKIISIHSFYKKNLAHCTLTLGLDEMLKILLIEIN